MNQIKLGSKARDIITGFTGIITSRATYLTGCDQYCIKPQKLMKDGSMQEGVYFDIEQIEILDAKPLKVNTRPTGGPRMDSAPIK